MKKGGKKGRKYIVRKGFGMRRAGWGKLIKWEGRRQTARKRLGMRKAG